MTGGFDRMHLLWGRETEVLVVVVVVVVALVKCEMCNRAANVCERD